MKKAVITSFDKNYLEYSKVLIKTLARNYHGEEILDVICLCTEDIYHLEKEYSNSINEMNINISFRVADNFKYIISQNTAKESLHYTKNAYHRLFAGSALPEYDIAIYIDPDTIINRDISPLLEYPMMGKVSAVLETINLSMATFKNSDTLYFNSGVMIMDLNFWRSENIEDKVINWIANNKTFEHMDQDCLNSILLEHIVPLPFTFNFYEFNVRANPTFHMQFNNPLIVHFAGKAKPWNVDYLSEYGDAWQKVFNEINDYS
jgi:UDP-glucose/galactose:(glucosyl)LPS alpha-1,2-glucosyl/galactosyltransferase